MRRKKLSDIQKDEGIQLRIQQMDLDKYRTEEPPTPEFNKKVINYIKSIYQNHTKAECARLVNEKFGTSLNRDHIQSCLSDLGLTKPCVKWTKEMETYLSSIERDYSMVELADIMSNKFGVFFSILSIQNRVYKLRREQKATKTNVQKAVAKQVKRGAPKRVKRTWTREMHDYLLTLYPLYSVSECAQRMSSRFGIKFTNHSITSYASGHGFSKPKFSYTPEMCEVIVSMFDNKHTKDEVVAVMKDRFGIIAAPNGVAAKYYLLKKEGFKAPEPVAVEEHIGTIYKEEVPAQALSETVHQTLETPKKKKDNVFVRVFKAIFNS